VAIKLQLFQPRDDALRATLTAFKSVAEAEGARRAAALEGVRQAVNSGLPSDPLFVWAPTIKPPQ